MNEFTIKDLENLSGIKAHTIRIWEQRYSFLKPKRTGTNIRYYCNDELKMLLNIALLNKYGFKISHIDRMRPQEISEKIMTLADVKAVQERIVNELIVEMAEMNMEKFEKAIDGYLASKGAERTVIQIVFPFLEKIGILWQTGHINPAQEHLVSNMIRQKLINAIETTAPRIRLNSTFLLFLPEGEHHELGLLFVHYLLKSKGVSVIYLGANVPVKDAAYVVQLKKPDVVFVHLTATGHNFHLDKFLQQLDRQFQNTPVVVSGMLTRQYHKRIPPFVTLKRSLTEVVHYISSL